MKTQNIKVTRNKQTCVAILSIGNELLVGSTINRNMSLIGQKLAEFGIEPKFQITVPDEFAKIAEALKFLSSRADLIISTGGLGPTSDDITKKAFADFFKLELRRDKQIEEKIRVFWHKRRKGKIPMSVFNQADLIVGGEYVPNEVGTAPGFIIRDKKKNLTVFILPGPPSEMMPMLESKIEVLVRDAKIYTEFCEKILTSGLAESLVEKITEKVLCGDPDIKPSYCASIEGTRIYLKSKNLEKIKTKSEELKKKLGKNCLFYGAENIFEEIFIMLRKRNKTISVAESCTGGLIAKRITDIPGASEIFKGGIVAYANLIKQNLLKVKMETLTSFGAVSKECAEEMLCGAREIFKTNTVISVTGIAGPQGASPGKPVGLVFIGTSYDRICEIRKYTFAGTRDQIRQRAAVSAINQLKEILLKAKC